MLVCYIFQACQFDQIIGRIEAVEDQLKLLFSSGIATALSTPPSSSAVAFAHQLTPANWPVVTTHQPAAAIHRPVVTTYQPAAAIHQPVA